MSNNPARLEINAAALRFNLQYFRNLLKPSTQILAVVKANGYGCGSSYIGKILEQEHIDYLCVAYLQEGIALRKVNIKSPILILFPQIESLDQLIAHHLEPNLYSLSSLKAFINALKKTKKVNYPIHLKLNTGMNRLGFTKDEIPQLQSILRQEKNIMVKSICTHFASSGEDRDREFTKTQIDRYINLYNALTSVLDYSPKKHVSNTSGIINYPEYQFDMVRLGLGLYGFGNDAQVTHHLKLVPRLKTNIFQLQYLQKGETVGYNRAFTTKTQSTIAIIPLGYSDGLDRRLSNHVGCVFINGKKAPIVGMVCMDMTMVDVTDIACKVGDEVIIFDHQDHILEMAKNLDTISYEIITTISPRIERILK